MLGVDVQLDYNTSGFNYFFSAVLGANCHKFKTTVKLVDIVHRCNIISLSGTSAQHQSSRMDKT